MPMTDAGLGSAIYSAITTGNPATNSAELQTFCNALGKAIVEYIQANAQVLPGIAVTTPAGPGATSSPGMIG